MNDNNKNDRHFDWLDDDKDGDDYRTYKQGVDHTEDSLERFRQAVDARDRMREGRDFDFEKKDEKKESQQEFSNEDSPEQIDPKLKKYIDMSIKKSSKKPAFMKGLALVIAGSLIGTMVGARLPRSNNGQDISNNVGPQSVSISASEEYNIESAVAKKATPSVVGIQVNLQRRVQGFWNDQIIQGEAIGSGVIVSQDGYILTNAHVVADADKEDGANVLFYDNSKANARILFVDQTLDLAVIKVDRTDLTPIEMGDSELVQVGDKAIAIGNPVGLNLQSTLTSGYISGINRSIQMQDSSVLDGLFQTDAAINSGNSGGALLNKNGQLIGINTAKVQSTDGIGFAIPINVAKPIIDSFIEEGSFEAVQLGIRGVNLDVYQQYAGDGDRFLDKKGVVIIDVAMNGNAQKAGLKSKDLIMEIKGEPIESMNKLKQVLLTISKGESADVKVLRNGNEQTISVIFDGQAPNI
ncbi:MAG: trypsin-like peptidase domain-containing protein [Tissierellia bacterium]|nr:trypsin-like peptidase domain-containing protein [Tissierellia bacterium]